MRTAVAAALLVTIGLTTAQANIIEADFTGTASGVYATGPLDTVVTFRNTPFTAQFFFDTAISTIVETLPGTFQLTENYPASASVNITGIGGFSIYGEGTLIWDASGPILADVNEGGQHIIDARITPEGRFQLGTCPDINNTPCGGIQTITSAFFVGPVPGPIAGAGIPGLILVGGLLGWLRRAKRGAGSVVA